MWIAHAANAIPDEHVQHISAVTTAAHSREYTVQPGDSLSIIAQRFYGHPLMWTHIYHANKSQIHDPNLIYAGQKLIIPQGGVIRSAPAAPRPSASPATDAQHAAQPARNPASPMGYIQQAAQGTGLPLSVVHAQVQVESGLNASAVSPVGAEGPYQFMPSTWAGLGFPAGQEFNWATSTRAYIAYMRQLIHWSGGNVRQALAAYNAGQGNWGAGLGYADQILSMAGQ
jgi:soluble lytic murein transglycosylase-like protein